MTVLFRHTPASSTFLEDLVYICVSFGKVNKDNELQALLTLFSTSVKVATTLAQASGGSCEVMSGALIWTEMVRSLRQI